ncbi:MAG TPA: right-handed parallel beta-helix repeat-containing protein [Thermoclostridium caenicola]|uniref:right-handed parallel beta-helix repeat-containing protein n=1 Tax=Thermoclostridium caenicola TaxID=659425 RepID=UPI002CC86D4E|nr:right-handed parallel beta-helix repeat-containing protein [Thermoclostridium caenicola]HOK43194.1 right-handed parallel beta-helix repeat-containing protein [Thermoclostridium caenicola]HPO77552.1 right-handed parallel beta-helix repeat-containing protein [Thermoclostridium caenicola]
MKYYVDVKAERDGDGSYERPFKRISDAAKIALPGDEVLVAPGIYREYVDPIHSGTEEARITYISTTPLGAVITGAEQVKTWKPYKDNVWVCRIPNSVFGDYNPYTTIVYGDWYFSTPNRHTGCVFLNDRAMYEATTLEECLKGEIYEYSWVPEESIYKWYTEQDPEKDETIIYANFQGLDPNKENVEITVRRRCFMPSKTGVSYITVRGFKIDKAATTWAPPAAFQEGMIGPHWSKGWIIEDCEISNSKCAGISLGKYFDPDNEHYFTYKQVKSPTQMERDAVCRGQYHGWLKEKVGSHIIRRCNIHHCEQGGIIGRMGGVFSIIEDNHIHHINNMMELGGAEISGIKLHAAIDVIIRRNHIHHCTMGIWCDWEAQGTRITQNLLHDNQRPPYAKHLPGGMMSQDIFVEVSHGPTLIDNNILLSDVSLRCATQGVAMVHNLICGAFTSVGEGTTWRYTPYHIPHRTEVMGFMTILHGDNRFYNNIFIQKWPSEDYVVYNDQDPQKAMRENRAVGTHVFDEYPTYEEWIAQFDFTQWPNMMALEPVHFGHLPVWSEGNVYLNGAKPWKKEANCLLVEKKNQEIKVELVEKDGHYYLDTNIFDYIKDFCARMIHTEILGKAFEPEQYFENPDGTPIRFDSDYFGDHRGVHVIPGPFASPSDHIKLY